MNRLFSIATTLSALLLIAPVQAQINLVSEHVVRADDGYVRMGPSQTLHRITDQAFYNPSVVLEVNGKFYGYVQSNDLDWDNCDRDRIWAFEFTHPADPWERVASAINNCSDPYPEMSPSTGIPVWGVGSLLKTPNRLLLLANHGRTTDLPSAPVSEDGGRWLYFSEQSMGRRIGDWRLILSSANTKYLIFDPVAFSLPLNNGDRRFGAFFDWYDAEEKPAKKRTGYLIHDFTTNVTDVLTTTGMVRVTRSGGYRLSPSVQLQDLEPQIPSTGGEKVNAVLMNEGIQVGTNRFLAYALYTAANNPGKHFARGFFYTSWGAFLGFDSKVFTYVRDAVGSSCALSSNVDAFITSVEALRTDPIFESWNRYFWWTQDTECTTWKAVNGPWQFDILTGRVQ